MELRGDMRCCGVFRSSSRPQKCTSHLGIGLVCLDETSKQLVQETRTPLPPRPGAAMAYDYEYQRNGVSNLFMLFAPLEGWRRVEVTDRRTRTDWAEVVRKLVDEDYADKERIVLVMDNPRIRYGAGSEHPPPGVPVRGLRAGGGAAHRPAAGDTLHTQARELAEYSGDRTGGAGAAVPGPPDSQPESPGAGNRSMAKATKPGGDSSGLALHHRGRPNQAQVPLPINTIAADY